MNRFRAILLSMAVAALVGATAPGTALASCASNPECNPTDICCNPSTCNWRNNGFACNPAGCAEGVCKPDGFGGKICGDLVPEEGSCNDGNDCTQNICSVIDGSCSNPNQAAGAAHVCNDTDPVNNCTVDHCTGLDENGVRYCEEGATPEDCSGEADQCNDAACEPASGCYAVPKPNSTVCTPQPDRCTTHNCNNGVCGVILQAGALCEGDNANNSDGLQCTKGHASGGNGSGCCDQETAAKASGIPCTDNNSCTATSICNGLGTCTGTVCAPITDLCTNSGCGVNPVNCINVTPSCGCSG